MTRWQVTVLFAISVFILQISFGSTVVLKIKEKATISHKPVVIVISFDGFRYNYFERTETPNLDEIRTSGASVPYMRDQFVTKTFPNHMSIATG